MQKPLHLIYIPGLGDRRVGAQRWAVGTWRWYGVTSELLQMNWADQEPWEPKLERLLERIDKVSAEGKSVALVGASAGAAAVISGFAARTDVLAGAVCIAGKINNPENIRSHYRRENPAFETAAYACGKALKTLSPDDRQRLLSRFAHFDEVVSNSDSLVAGARNQRVLSIGHVPTIALQLTLSAPGFIRFLKRQSSRA